MADAPKLGQPWLFVGGLSGRVFLATRWHTEGGGERYVADEKIDMTDQFVRCVADLADEVIDLAKQVQKDNRFGDLTNPVVMGLLMAAQMMEGDRG